MKNQLIEFKLRLDRIVENYTRLYLTLYPWGRNRFTMNEFGDLFGSKFKEDIKNASIKFNQTISDCDSSLMNHVNLWLKEAENKLYSNVGIQSSF